MLLKSKPVGSFAMNCYLIACPETRKGAIIDPGEEMPWIEATVKEMGIEVQYILLTHSHLDHVGALAAAQARWPDAPICVHEDEMSIYRRAPEMARMFGLRFDPLPDPDQFIKDGEVFKIGNLSLKVLTTPGHSPGGVSFIVEDEGIVFTGDALFAGSIGRTDLPGCDQQLLIRSLGRLRELPGHFRVLSGHGPESTIARERQSNPFLIEAYGRG